MISKTCTLFLFLALPSALASAAMKTAYDYNFISLYGEEMPLSQYQGNVLLVVNTASRCGYTPQYDDLQALWEAYQDQGLVVIGVPSNDFGGQEPGSTEEIKDFCEVNFGINFPMTEKVVVKGDAAHPFYLWARDEMGAENAPGWNFHKYLVDRDGALVAAFPSQVEPLSAEMTAAIEAEL